MAPISLFAGMDGVERKPLVCAFVNVHAAPDDAVIRKGDPAEVVFIASAAAEVDTGHGDATRPRRGDMFGQLALLSGQPQRGAPVRAISRCAFLMLDRSHYRAHFMALNAPRARPARRGAR